MRIRKTILLAAIAIWAAAQQPAKRPDGLYAEIKMAKGTIVARLEMDLVPMTVSNFVGLAEGTIANAAFDPDVPYFDGTPWPRVEAGHVIQTGNPKSTKARGPGYQFPNEIHAKLSHNHMGVLNMANGGPNTNAATFCIMLGDRSYLDGDYTVFGDTVEGLDVVQKVEKNDVIESIRIIRVGAKAQAFHPTTESFQAMVKAAKQRVEEHVEKKKIAEHDWIAKHYPKAAGPDGGVLTEQLSRSKNGTTAGGIVQVKYKGTQLRYKGLVIGWTGPILESIPFASRDNGVPGFEDRPKAFSFDPAKTKINPGLDGVIKTMRPGEKRRVIVPGDLGYGRGGSYPPAVPGKKRFAISPNALLVYEVEVL